MSLLKNFSVADRPREKLLQIGAENLTNAELLAILLNTSGQKNRSVLDLGRELIGQTGTLRELASRSTEELMTRKGIGSAKAVMVQATFELARRYETERRPLAKKMNSARAIASHFLARFRDSKKEVFTLLCVSSQRKLLKEKQIASGSLTTVIAEPREIFSPAFACHASGIILLHNHPSGDPTPSEEDEEITSRIKSGGKLLGIPLLDHIILGEDSYFSFQEAGML